ncbi:mannose-6-phosphate isomerase, class I [Epidermidibacterium keratini]|uniref:mannose-6-phosphate isomerase n=1 Tax=Epidermidibacterium keratini TaxID=1891644 RepID=A0A7L4YRY6_9ACTN|nr:mannose-6-phosphate isomerase, class I [Epidermidibacterium keratini]QHC01559.1 mannose-6-phosphate isomerase, class I [Epidermidibacterium keratini]
MHRLENDIRNYAWGSHRVLAEFGGRPSPTARPEAELWIGAHPSTPSRLVGADGTSSLADAIAADPHHHLGSALAAEYDGRLPFLFKVLAAEQPLSIQAHPSHAQAKAGFAAEEELGIPRDDPKRNYKDPFAKPEVFVAQTEAEVLCGFRRSAHAAHLLSRLGVATLAPYIGSLLAGRASDGFRVVVTTLLSMPEEKQSTLAAQVAAESARAATASDVNPDEARAYEWVARLHEAYPGDVGVVISLLMNLVTLAPGQAVYHGPGVPHAYLRGSGLEAQGNSDNTLRGGLTPKHVDVAELLKVLDFEPLTDPVITAQPVPGSPAMHWPTPAREFGLYECEVTDDPHVMSLTGPRIALCLEGTTHLASGDTQLELRRGESAYFAAAEPDATLTGAGRVAVIAAGQVRRAR